MINIDIYINTHSPMFIEAMRLYSNYYDILYKGKIELPHINI